MWTVIDGEGFAEERRNVPRCHRVLKALAICLVERSLRLHDREDPSDEFQPRRVRRNEQQLYPSIESTKA